MFLSADQALADAAYFRQYIAKLYKATNNK